MSGRPGSGAKNRFERILVSSRLLIFIPVVFLLIDAAGSFVYGCIILVTTATDFVHEPNRPGSVLGRFLIVMDTYLVGATLMIAAFGFYALFINGEPDGARSLMPAWLKMRDLEDLKARVVSMLILVAAITFVDVLVETHNQIGVFYLGIGIAVLIVALTGFLRFGRQTHAPAISGARAAAQAIARDDDAGAMDKSGGNGGGNDGDNGNGGDGDRGDGSRSGPA